MAIDTRLLEYHVDGFMSSALDAATAPAIHVAYWLVGTDHITSRAHLEFIISIGIYSVDVNTTMTYLKSLPENENREAEKDDVRKILGSDLKVRGLTDVSIKEPLPNDILTIARDGRVINKTQRDHKFTRANTLFSSYLNNNWVKIGTLEVETENIDVNDYKITVNMTCELSNNGRRAIMSIFVNDIEQTHITQQFRWDQGNDTKSVTIIDILNNVEPRSTIDIRIKRGSGNGSTFKVYRRTMFAEELI